MLEAISQPFRKPTWTLVYCSAKIVGSGVMQHSHAESKVQNAPNATDHTNLNTIRNLASAARQMPRSTYQDWKRKKGEPCSHTFKCLNCQGDHQADSNQCLFWRHRFNREWHQRKYAEICENRSKSIYSGENGGAQYWLWKTSNFFCKTFTRTPSSLIPSSRL